MDEKTLKEVEDWETKKFGSEVLQAPALKKEDVVTLLHNATIMGELPFGEDGYFENKIVDPIYTGRRCNPHYLKKYVIIEYPLFLLKMVLKEEAFTKFDTIGLLLHPGEKEYEDEAGKLNAYAEKLPSGKKGIFFSEWLYAFLWDYHYLPPGVSRENSSAGEDPDKEAEREQLRVKVTERIHNGRYPDWPIEELIKERVTEKEQKFELTFSLLFLFCHEFAHIYLNHLDSTMPKKHGERARYALPGEFDQYNSRQILEHDADLLASDLYFRVMDFWTSGHKELMESFYADGITLLNVLAKIEGKNNWNGIVEHPPSILRLMYIYLRHEDRFLVYGMDPLIDDMKKHYEKRRLPPYDYTKDLGAQGLFS